MSRIAYPVTSLGPGRRMGIWVQGCSLKCPGCISKDTWDERSGTLIDEQQLAKSVAEIISQENLDGIAVTGGEPTNQASSLSQFLAIVLNELPQVNTVIFSGVEKEKLLADFTELTQYIDLAICGPYVVDLPSDRPLISSDNQQYVPCSNRGEELLSMISDASFQHEIQFDVDIDDITMVGLPFPHGMELLEEELRKRGIVFSEVSWKQ